MQTVIVTGGAGYIGSHVCKTLKQAGFLPVTVDNLSQGNKWAVKWGPLVQLEIADKEGIKKLIKEFQPFAVMHLASSINVRDSIKNPFLYYENNVTATLKLLEAVCETSVRHVVFSSSAAIYGQPIYTPIDETHAKLPIHPYGKSKLMAEEILQDLHAAYGLNFATLRYFNAAGADPDAEIGEVHNPETHLIPLAIKAAMQSGQASGSILKINGLNFPTEDGTAIRDYIHVTDLAEAHLKALLWIFQNKQNLTLNLGAGAGFSVRQIIQAVEEVTGCTIAIQEGPRFAEDPSILVADATRARELLQWTPRYSALKTIVETAYAWHKQNALVDLPV